MTVEKYIYESPQEVAEAFAKYLIDKIAEADMLRVALSGGSTPKLLFDVLSHKYQKAVNWNQVQFYWGDERCVNPTDPQSNYLMTMMHLFRHIEISEANIHRMYGECDPNEEARRYGDLLSESLPERDGLPVFDLVILGMGDDGHTASIFPHQTGLLNSEKVCEVARHPESGQQRVTLTGSVINNSAEVCFLVTGEKKTVKIDEIFNKKEGYESYPAAHIYPRGKLSWWMDAAAAKSL